MTQSYVEGDPIGFIDPFGLYKDPLDSIPQFRAQKELKPHSYDSLNTREENNSPGDPLTFIFGVLSISGTIDNFFRKLEYKRERTNFNPEDSLLFDDAGKQLIRHFLTGNGDDFIINNEPYWNFYLGNNTRIQDEIGRFFDDELNKIFIECNGIYPDKVYFEGKSQMEVTNGGGYTSGYSMINGTNGSKVKRKSVSDTAYVEHSGGGGFTASGVGIKRTGITYLISYTAFLEDVFDFNMSYAMDNIKYVFASTYDFLDTKIEMNIFNIEINFKGTFIYQAIMK